MTERFHLRPAAPEDNAFLRDLFAQTRPGLSLLPSPLQEMQFRARSLGYAEQFPDLKTFLIIGENNVPLGTLLLAEQGHALRIVDLAVLPAHQGHGAGTFAIRFALSCSQEVRLRVQHGNPAVSLYQRLGFHPVSSDGPDIEMSSKSSCPKNGAIEGVLEFGPKPSEMNTLRLKVRGGTLALLTLVAGSCFAQGILTVSPGATASTVAGTGISGYTGDNAAANSATLSQPGAIAYDLSGNLYIADTNNHVIREVSVTGTITTIAGNGTEGFSGDNGAATAAQLDSPTGIAVDASGNLYIADSHNHRIRKVSGGTITTIAGTGIAGFSGDGSAATSAQLALPSGIAVDSSGNLYIADTNNHRIREVSGGTIATIAGDGEELFAGDGGAATSAALDSPTGVAVSSSAVVYVADRLNQRIRAFTVGGTISTVAGSGSGSFSGGYAGDGANATAASLARPSGVSVDASGNIYVADTDNQRIRKLVSGGAIATVIGTGDQGFAADGGLATNAVLNTPKSAAPDAAGNLLVADTLDQRVRKAMLPTLTFGNDGVGILSAAQPVTLSNTGAGTLSVGLISFTGPFTTAIGGSCSAPPISLGPGGNCTQNVAFLPTGVGADTGSVVFGGGTSVPQSVLLAGTAIQTATTTKLTTSVPTALAGQSVILTATLQPAGLGSPTGSVTFYDNGVALATVNVSNSSAMLTLSTLPTGTDSITASYGGDSNFIASTSGALNQLVEDFSLTVSGVSVLSVAPGSSATFGGTLQSLQGPFSFPIALSVTGLPQGAVATFNPASITLGSTGQATATLTIQTASTARLGYPRPLRDGTVFLAFLLLPLSLGRRLRRRFSHMRYMFVLATLAVLGGLTTLTGCGSGSGLLGQQQQTYSINLIGTATGANGATLQHTTVVSLTVQ